MPNTSNCLLCNTALIRKFCKLMDREFGCKSAFGCTDNLYFECISCPLVLAFNVKYVMDMKNIPLGEAFRICLRSDVDAVKGREILAEHMKEKDWYPKKPVEKKNE